MNAQVVRMPKLVMLSGSAHQCLAKDIARSLGVMLSDRALERFPDGEIHTELREDVADADVYIVQPANSPVAENVLEVLLLADAARRAGAARITAVVPYLGYARQDRRTSGGQPLGAHVVARLFAGCVDRMVTVDLHSCALEGFFDSPVEHVTAVPLLAGALRAFAGRDGVVVAPDHGAAKLADEIGRALDLPTALVSKTRVSATEVHARRVVGDVRGRAPIIVDDMVSTGGTMVAAYAALVAQGCLPRVTIAATHGLFVGPAIARLRELPLERVFITDSVAPVDFSLPGEIVGLGVLLADVVRRLHGGTSVSSLLSTR
ncbi:MAG: ribose-phosphate pyrophosphokinase [Deltaproteobacteria bacterium]